MPVLAPSLHCSFPYPDPEAPNQHSVRSRDMGFDPALADEDYCYLTTTGRVSGQPREIEIWFGLRGDSLYMLSGGRDRSDWVRNLMQDPAVTVRIADEQLPGRARVVEDPEEDALARRLLFEKYSPRYSGDLENWRQNALPVAVDFVAAVGLVPGVGAGHLRVGEAGFASVAILVHRSGPASGSRSKGRTGRHELRAGGGAPDGDRDRRCSWALFPASAAAGPHRADGRLSDWRGDATMLSGESRVSKGELIHDDWLYDDYGADLDNVSNMPVFRAALAPTRGDYRYPTNSARYGYNAADLRQLRVSASGAGLHIAAFLQTMKEPDAAAVTLGIDTGRAREGVGLARRRRDRLARRRHVHHVLGHRRLDHRPPRAPRAAAPPGREPGRERDRGGRAVALDPVRARPHRDAVRGQRPRRPAGRRLQAGSARAGERDAARRRPARLRPPRSTRPSTRRRNGPAWSAATGARSASRGCLRSRTLSGLGQRVRISDLEGGVTRALRARARSLLQPDLPLHAELRRGHQPEAADRPGTRRQPRPAVPVAAPAVRALPARRLRRRARPRRCCSTATRWT